MNKRASMRKIISAALTAATMGLGVSNFGRPSFVSAADGVGSSVSSTDHWELVETVNSEAQADFRIEYLADSVWQECCNNAVELANVDKEKYVNDRGLAKARGVFGNTLLTCYAKQKGNRSLDHIIRAPWHIRKNDTQLKNLQNTITQVLKGYFLSDNEFNSKKDLLSKGVRLTILDYLTNTKNTLEKTNSELKNLPMDSELVLRQLIFGQQFGDSATDTPGLLEGVLNIPSQKLTKDIEKVISDVKNQKDNWQKRISELKNSQEEDSD